MSYRRHGAWAALATLSWVAAARAEPATTAWVEDVAVQEEDTTQTVLGFEHHLTDIKARGGGIDRLSARVDAGVAPLVAIAPEATFMQRGEEPLRLEQVALQGRWRVLDGPGWPLLMVHGSYANELSDRRDHLFSAGAAAGYAYGSLHLNAELRPTLQLGGDQGRTLESWSGLAIGYGWTSTWLARAGLEAFAIIPLIGERLSDPTFGEGAESNTYYAGPSFALATGPFWTSASAVTGYGISLPASQFLLSWVVGVAH